MFSPYRLTVPLSATSETEPYATICFSVQAVADCGLISRVLEQFAKRGLMPAKVVAASSGDVGLLDIDIQVPDLTLPDGEQIARSLRAIVGVGVVLTSEKHGQRATRP